MQHNDMTTINLKRITISYGLDLSTFFSLPEEYRDALIHGGFVLERKNNIWNNINDREKIKRKMLSFLQKNK